MAKAGVAVFLAVATTAGLAGCGTIANLSDQSGPGEKKVYGGVRLDAKLASGYAGYAARSDGVYSLFAAGTACALAADLPVSALADTLTLPCTLMPAAKKSSRHHEEEAGDEDGEPPTRDAGVAAAPADEP
jgi:uncharacterized protein YceK